MHSEVIQIIHAYLPPNVHQIQTKIDSMKSLLSINEENDISLSL